MRDRPGTRNFLPLVAVLALGLAVAWPNAAHAEPTVTISAPSAAPGDKVVVTLAGWDVGVVTVSLCGNEARRGSVDCDLRNAVSAGPFGEPRPELAELLIAPPPAPCPCVVRVATTAYDAVRTVPIVVEGVADAPVVVPGPPETPLRVTARVGDASVSPFGRLRSWLGGPTRRTLLLTIENTGAEAVSNVTVSAAVGRDRQDGAPLELPAVETLRPRETRDYLIPLRLPAPAFGTYLAFGTVYGPGPPVQFEVDTSTSPWLLVLVGLTLAVALAAIAVHRARPRTTSRMRGTERPARRPPPPVAAPVLPVLVRSPAEPPATSVPTTMGRVARSEGLPHHRPPRPPRSAPVPSLVLTRTAARLSVVARPFHSTAAMVATAAAAVVLTVVVVAASRPTGGIAPADAQSASPSAMAPSTSPATGGGPAGGPSATMTTTTVAAQGGDGGAAVAFDGSVEAAPIPARIQASPTSGLRDGDGVSLRVEADPGSQIFGFEAFLCADGAVIQLDADIRPDDTGNCVSKPLSAGSDRYKEAKGRPPYEVVETVFRAGVGTDEYITGEGTPVSITCGPAHPCQLVVKVQYPDGFGFRAVRLDYA